MTFVLYVYVMLCRAVLGKPISKTEEQGAVWLFSVQFETLP